MEINITEKHAHIATKFALSRTIVIRNQEEELVEFLRWVAKNRVNNFYGSKTYNILGSVEVYENQINVKSKVDKAYAEMLAEAAEHNYDSIVGKALWFNGVGDVVGMTEVSNVNGASVRKPENLYTIDQIKVALKDTSFGILRPSVSMVVNKNLTTFTEAVLDDMIESVEVNGRIYRFTDSIIPYIILLQFPIHSVRQLYELKDEFKGKAGETMFWYFTYQYFEDSLFGLLDAKDYEMVELIFLSETFNLMEELQNDNS